MCTSAVTAGWVGDSKNRSGLVQFAFVTIRQSNPVWSGVRGLGHFWTLDGYITRVSAVKILAANLISWRSWTWKEKGRGQSPTVIPRLEQNWDCNFGARSCGQERGAEPKLHCPKMWCMSCNHPELNCCNGRSRSDLGSEHNGRAFSESCFLRHCHRPKLLQASRALTIIIRIPLAGGR